MERSRHLNVQHPVRLLVLVFSLMVTTKAVAEEVNVTPADDYLDGRIVFDLRRMIEDQRADLDLGNATLNHVDVELYGEGTARLYVEGKRRDREDFDTDDRGDPMRLRNDGDSAGSWELILRGEMDIDAIVVDLTASASAGSAAGDGNKSYSPDDGWELQRYCNCRTNKRCYVRHHDGDREVGKCLFDCPHGCKG